MAEADWRAVLEAAMRPHWDQLGDPVAVLREFVHAITSALTGDFDPFIELVGRVPILGDIVKGAANLLSGGRLINLGQLTAAPVNLLPGGFDSAESLQEGEGWSWDAVEGHLAPGCAMRTLNGEPGMLFSPAPAEVEPGKAYDASCWMLGVDQYPSGAQVHFYNGSNQHISTVGLAAVDGLSPGWTLIAAYDIVAPAEARWAHFVLEDQGSVGPGAIRWDDAGIWSAQTTLPQQIIAGLTDALEGLSDWIEALVDRILDALGVPKLGGLFDRILDAGDALSELQDTAEDGAAAVRDLFDTIGGHVGANLADVEQRLTAFLTAASNLDGGKIVGSVSAALIAGVLDLARIPALPVTKVTNLQTIIAALDGRASTAEADIVDLQDRSQALEGVVGYGSAYMSGSPGVSTSATLMQFDQRVGPMVGATLAGGRFTLGSKGLWRFEAQVRFWGAKYAPPKCFMDIIIRNSGGTEIARLKAMASSDDEITVTNVMPAVVPSAGCTAEVVAWTSAIPIIGGNWRGIGGGYSTTRFSVFKISEETS
ncbi:hypothetical protein [Gordonia alkaliphila]